MLTDQTCIVSEDVSLEGETIELPINDDSVSNLWNTTRHDASHSDGSGPAKIGVMVVADGETDQYILPVHMALTELTEESSKRYAKLVGSKTF